MLPEFILYSIAADDLSDELIAKHHNNHEHLFQRTTCISLDILHTILNGVPAYAPIIRILSKHQPDSHQYHLSISFPKNGTQALKEYTAQDIKEIYDTLKHHTIDIRQFINDNETQMRKVADFHMSGSFGEFCTQAPNVLTTFKHFIIHTHENNHLMFSAVVFSP